MKKLLFMILVPFILGVVVSVGCSDSSSSESPSKDDKSPTKVCTDGATKNEPGVEYKCQNNVWIPSYEPCTSEGETKDGEHGITYTCTNHKWIPDIEHCEKANNSECVMCSAGYVLTNGRCVSE